MPRAWRHRDTLPGDDNGVRGRLFTVARNVGIDARVLGTRVQKARFRRGRTFRVMT
jgi:hypothetical protein